MKKKFLNIIPLFFCAFVFINNGFCLDSKSIETLIEAGVDGETIQLIIKEKIIETCAFTVQEILDLKRTGMGNETLRMFIESVSFMKDTDPIEYGDRIKLIKFTNVNDIIKLKNAGISDEVIKEILSGIKDEDDQENKRAWDMLKNMGLIIDEREQ